MGWKELEPGIKIGPVTCGLCGTPVERVVFFRDDLSQEIVMVAHCHGAKDERRIPDNTITVNAALELEESIAKGGVAFDQTKLLTRDSR